MSLIHNILSDFATEIAKLDTTKEDFYDNVFLFLNNYNEGATNVKNTLTKFVFIAVIISAMLSSDTLTPYDPRIIIIFVLFVLQMINEIVNTNIGVINGFSYALLTIAIICIPIVDLVDNGLPLSLIFVLYALYNIMILNISFKNSNFKCGFRGGSPVLEHKDQGYILPLMNQLLTLTTIALMVLFDNKAPAHSRLLIFIVIGNMVFWNYILHISNIAYFRDVQCDSNGYKKPGEDQLVETKKIFTIIGIPLALLFASAIGAGFNDGDTQTILLGLVIISILYIIISVVTYYIIKAIQKKEGNETQIIRIVPITTPASTEKPETSKPESFEDTPTTTVAPTEKPVEKPGFDMVYLNNKNSTMNDNFNKYLYIFIYLILFAFISILFNNDEETMMPIGFYLITVLLTFLGSLNFGSTLVIGIFIIAIILLLLLGIIKSFGIF